MGRLVRDDRKTTVTQIATRYNQDIQNTISEHTTRRTLKQMSSSSRRPHRVPLLSDKNRTRRIQFTQTHQNQTIEDCKNVAWSDESWFLLRYSDGRVRIWHKEHESMDSSCLVSAVQAGSGDVMVWGIFFWHTLADLIWALWRCIILLEVASEDGCTVVMKGWTRSATILRKALSTNRASFKRHSILEYCCCFLWFCFVSVLNVIITLT